MIILFSESEGFRNSISLFSIVRPLVLSSRDANLFSKSVRSVSYGILIFSKAVGTSLPDLLISRLSNTFLKLSPHEKNNLLTT
jgi:hypothetical protein